MGKKLMSFKTKGMNRDLSVSAFNPEFAFENMNLRLSTNDGNTQLSWVNEKGTLLLNVYSPAGQSKAFIMHGMPIGTAIIDHKLVLFTTEIPKKNPDGTLQPKKDYIYILKYNNVSKTSMEGEEIYDKDLGFDIEHPLETMVSYEAKTIQKVYWTDGKNQPRVINVGTDLPANVDETYFDFVRTLKLKETVTVKKMLDAKGMFAPGVIQYAFTYYTKYGQETNIFYTTPLYYISYADRGASPEDKVGNAFRITIDGIDKRFDFLRIYSIQRTSIDGTPICKRIQDIDIKNILDTQNSVSYTDTGFSGNSIDPTELLYKGGEEIAVETLEQKDNTLFLGNIKHIGEMNELDLDNTVLDAWELKSYYRTFTANPVSSGDYEYASQLTAESDGETVPCGGFKGKDYYRLGVQFQYKTGRWSKPVWLADYQVEAQEVSGNQIPYIDGNKVTVPTVTGTITSGAASSLIKAGYYKVRPIVVFPGIQDRVTICQGVCNPTLFTENRRNNDKSMYAQASWFFRPPVEEDSSENPYINASVGTVSPMSYLVAGSVISSSDSYLKYADRHIANGTPDAGDVYDPKDLRQVEIEGDFDSNNRFQLDWKVQTFNSPDIEFDDKLSVMTFPENSIWGNLSGTVEFKKTLSDIDIQTETPTLCNKGSGFIHKPFVDDHSFGIVSGLFYEDYMLEDYKDPDTGKATVGKTDYQKSPFEWMIYLWGKSGSLNNDFNRPADLGVQTAKLKKKVISNLRYAETEYYNGTTTTYTFSEDPKLFSSDEVTILKTSEGLYQGNVDTALIPDHQDGSYFAFESADWTEIDIKTPFTSVSWWKTYYEKDKVDEGLYKWNDSTEWVGNASQIGDKFVDIVTSKESVRMKYKSSPHMLFMFIPPKSSYYPKLTQKCKLPILDLRRTVDTDTLFGGKSKDAFRENTWIPCGKPVRLDNIKDDKVTFEYSYGDTYYQRWDCLKTYAFTPEDINQVVEIGSFMLETHVNIDGRYDRNRGQMNNLNMSPRNYNLLNPVYSQVDNFFSYKIMDDDAYNNRSYPNLLTWSKTKENGADTDLWTNITLASVLELDGDKGEITSIDRFNDQLIAFQDSGISQILYNENVQIQSTEGVPIEIANSGKVQGKRYLSDTVGCSNKWSIVQTPLGIYFMESNEKAIYLFNGQLNNISSQYGFNSWCKQMIPSAETKWNPTFPFVDDTVDDKKSNFVGYYDRMNQDVLWINRRQNKNKEDISKALAFSEKFGAFTSFYDYGDTPFFCNLDDTGIWIKRESSSSYPSILWKHHAGSYCLFFGREKPYWMTLVGNSEPQQDCIFTNLEFRSCVSRDSGKDYYEGTAELDPVTGEETGKFNFYMPFDILETWNEYQHGIAELSIKNGHDQFKHHLKDDPAAHLDRKFRMWRCDIPRNNAVLDDDRVAGGTYNYSKDRELGIARHYRKPNDRMRNPWIYIKLMKNVENTGRLLPKAETHDIVLTYYD